MREILTVVELIEILKKLPEDLEVYQEGCDCYGGVTDAVICDPETKENLDRVLAYPPENKCVVLERY